MEKKRYRAMIFLKSGQMVRSGVMELADEEYHSEFRYIDSAIRGIGDTYRFCDTIIRTEDISAIRLAEEE